MSVDAAPNATTTRDALYIGGRWQASTDGDVITVISPSTEEPVGSAAVAGPGDIGLAVSAARRAFDAGDWPRMTAGERADVLARMAAGIAKRAAEIEYLGGAEVGAIVAMATAFRMGAQLLLQYYSGAILDVPTTEEITGLVSEATVRRVPLGVVAAVLPWNAPLTTALFTVAPALAAGCTVVVKSPVEAPLATYVLGDIASEAGLPDGVLNIVCANNDVSEALVRHPGVDKVCFTGSTAVGRRIASICGERLVSATLELGGKSAAIILDDADPGPVAAAVAPLTMLNSGQACTNATRVLVPRRRRDEFVEALAAAIAQFRVGDPFDPAVFVGPLISDRQRSRVEGYIEAGLREGARIVTGGGRPAGLTRGFYIEPTLFDEVDNTMTIAREEIFGPVAAVITYDDEEDAIAIANDSDYGLSGNVWSPDAERATRVAYRIRTGNIGINGNFLDWAVPFGGMKQSGLGREFGVEGLRAFYELQAVHRVK